MRHSLAAVFAALCWFALPAGACSTVACIDKGFEMRPDFAVTVQHDDRPLAGVRVEVIDSRPDGAQTRRFLGITAGDGRVTIASLPPGEYWLRVQLLGVYAAYHCFHVATKPSRKAKHRLNFDWGDLAPSTRRVQGKLVDCQPGEGETPFLKFLHCVKVPVVGARFRLQNAVTGATYSTTSIEDGSFSFALVPKGTYVLHVEGGRTPSRDYDSTDLLFKVSPTAKPNMLWLTRKDPGWGSCGGTSLDFTTSAN